MKLYLIFLDLNSPLSDINSLPALIWLLFAKNLFSSFFPFQKLCALRPKQSLEDSAKMLCFISSANLCLLIGACSNYAIEVFTNGANLVLSFWIVFFMFWSFVFPFFIFCMLQFFKHSYTLWLHLHFLLECSKNILFVVINGIM